MITIIITNDYYTLSVLVIVRGWMSISIVFCPPLFLHKMYTLLLLYEMLICAGNKLNWIELCVGDTIPIGIVSLWHYSYWHCGLVTLFPSIGIVSWWHYSHWHCELVTLFPLALWVGDTIDPIHAAAMTDKKRGLGCRFTANLRVST